MKKRIAVFSNGWSTEFLRLVLDGIRKRAFELNIDIYLFINYAVDVRGEMFSQGECNIYRFPDLSEFDGAIILPGTFNSEEAVAEVRKRVLDSGIPSISVEYEVDGIDFIGTENFEASYQIAKHILEVHKAKNIIYMGGPSDNKDSRERLIGVQRALKEAGIVLKDDCILNGVYAYKPSRNVMGDWMDKHDYCPDAVICANDDMAIGVCSYFADNGIRVPEDVVVTGYDALRAGQRFQPTLTSVHRSWSKVGAYAVDNIMDKINGLITNPHVLLDTRPVFKESCGCNDAARDEKFIVDMREVLVKDHVDSLERVLTLEYISMICDVFEDVELQDNMSQKIYSLVNGTDKYLGDVIKLFVNESFFDVNVTKMRDTGYDDEMRCICDVDKGGYKTVYKVNRSEFVANLANTAGDHHFFIVLPVQKMGECYGVIVFDDCLKYVYDYSFNAIEDNVDGAVKQMRQASLLIASKNRLQDLSERDSLTGIYNRLAYGRYVEPLLEQLKNENKNGQLMIVDIDKMKTINDHYGHLLGDTAIKIVADALMQVLPEDWFVIRYGGDEFIIVGEANKDITAESVLKLVKQKIKEYMDAHSEIPFNLSVSLGAQIIKPTDDNDFSYHFKMADDSMYMMKEVHHDQIDKQGI